MIERANNVCFVGILIPECLMTGLFFDLLLSVVDLLFMFLKLAFLPSCKNSLPGTFCELKETAPVVFCFTQLLAEWSVVYTRDYFTDE